MLKGKDVILGILTRGDQTGYEINQLFQSIFSHFFDGGYGMIYPTLKRLEQEGLVIKKEITQVSKPNKNVFSITSQGQAQFNHYLQSELSPEILKSDYLVRMFFGESLSKEQLLAFTRTEIARKEEQLLQLKLDYQLKIEEMTATQRLTYDYGINYYAAVLEVMYQEEVRLVKM